MYAERKLRTALLYLCHLSGKCLVFVQHQLFADVTGVPLDSEKYFVVYYYEYFLVVFFP